MIESNITTTAVARVLPPEGSRCGMRTDDHEAIAEATLSMNCCDKALHTCGVCAVQWAEEVLVTNMLVGPTQCSFCGANYTLSDVTLFTEDGEL